MVNIKVSVEQQNLERFGTRGAGFDLSNLESTTREEIDAHLHAWVLSARERGISYGLNAHTILVENRPDFAKLQVRGGGGIPTELIEHPARPIMQNIRVMLEYIRIGWETGIYNEFRELQMRGMTKAQIMELVMFAQLSGGGIRSMGHVHNAVGKSLFDWADGASPTFPDGWAPDPDAFKAGLDLTVGDLTVEDRKNILAWYEQTMDWVPKSIRFAIKHQPRFLKAQRAKWESVFQVLPKQVAPFLMLAQHTVTGFREGLREGALLAKAWGFTPAWVLEPITGQAYYFKGMEALEAAYDAIDDVLDNWDR
jgi:hypothetical protein